MHVFTFHKSLLSFTGPQHSMGYMVAFMGPDCSTGHVLPKVILESVNLIRELEIYETYVAMNVV